MVKKNPHIISNSIKYNRIIKEIASNYNFITVIDPLNGKILQDIFDDGYHPNPKGNNLVFNDLVLSFEK